MKGRALSICLLADLISLFLLICSYRLVEFSEERSTFDILPGLLFFLATVSWVLTALWVGLTWQDELPAPGTGFSGSR